MVSGAALTARRRAREIVGDMRWRGMPVPPLYDRMAREFGDLVRNGDYAAWVAANQTPSLVGKRPPVRGLPVLEGPHRAGAAHPMPWARRTSARRPARRVFLLPGPVSGR
jgi:hypothetical protein